MKLENLKYVHFIGIKGVAVSALAIIAAEAGIRVTGSDKAEAFFGDDLLNKYPIEIMDDFKPEHIKDPDLVIATAAHNGLDNVEAQTAREKGIPTLSYSQALRIFTQGKKVLAVCGTHGKTTTSVMLAYILNQAGMDPSFIVGVKHVPDLGSNAHYGKGEYFVIEGDEYVSDLKYDRKPKFLNLNPYGVIITSIDHDHPDVYPDLKSVENVFKKLIKLVPQNGVIVSNSAYKNIIKLAKGAKAKLKYYNSNKLWPSLKLRVFGEYNLLNATAAARMAHEIGVETRVINKSLANFTGIGRRMQLIGENEKVIVIDDYAHHPIEIQNALRSIKEHYKDKKLWVVFEPHTYSRTEALKEEFARSFNWADGVVITDIYASARESQGTITPSDLIDLIKKNKKDEKIFYCPMENIVEFLKKEVEMPAVVVTMGAGNVYKKSKDIFKELNKKS